MILNLKFETNSVNEQVRVLLRKERLVMRLRGVSPSSSNTQRGSPPNRPHASIVYDDTIRRQALRRGEYCIQRLSIPTSLFQQQQQQYSNRNARPPDVSHSAAAVAAILKVECPPDVSLSVVSAAILKAKHRPNQFANCSTSYCSSTVQYCIDLYHTVLQALQTSIVNNPHRTVL